MKLRCILLGLSLPWLAGCTISDNEQRGLDEVQQRYGGNVSFKIGTFVSTKANQAQGKQLEIDLRDANLVRYGSLRGLPASNAAMLLYARMTPGERANYQGLRVVIQQQDSTFTFSYPMPVLAEAARAYGQLNLLLENWRQRRYQQVADRWNQAALTGPARDGLVAVVARQGAKMGFIASFLPEGFLPGSARVANHREQLLNVYATVAAPDGGSRQLLFCLNPQLPPTGQFLYGMQFLGHSAPTGPLPAPGGPG